MIENSMKLTTTQTSVIEDPLENYASLGSL